MNSIDTKEELPTETKDKVDILNFMSTEVLLVKIKKELTTYYIEKSISLSNKYKELMGKDSLLVYQEGKDPYTLLEEGYKSLFLGSDDNKDYYWRQFCRETLNECCNIFNDASSELRYKKEKEYYD